MDINAFLTEHGVWIVKEDSVIETLRKNNFIVNEFNKIGGEYVLKLSDEQYNFWLNHCDEELNIYQIFNMESKSQEELLAQRNIEIENTRRKLYKDNADHLFLAYQKYLLRGNIEKAEEVKTLWLSKVKEIEDNNPYITE